MRTIRHPHHKDRLEEYVKGLIEGIYTLKQVSGFTGYTVQHLCALKHKYKQQGSAAFINGHKGKPVKKAVPEKTRRQIIQIYREDFEGFNFLFFQKCLKEFHNIHLSYKTIYNLLSSEKIESPEKHRRQKQKPVHRPRFRREQGGEMVQMDATPYRWFSWCGDNTYYALHGAIDDAEEKITGLYMTENECSYGYYDVLEQTAKNFGIPADIYTDRSSIFCVTPKDRDKMTVQEQLAGLHEKRTQWQRILDELRINQILAWSPQAKGRVERLWRTIQGRLPWYFRKYGIKNPEEANKFLKEKYIHIFNTEFAIKREKKSIWRKPPENLKQILCSKFRRRCNSAGIISFQGYRFQVKAPGCSCRDIELCVFRNGIKARMNGTDYDVVLQDDIQDGIDERMSNATKNIIYQYMYADTKKISA